MKETLRSVFLALGGAALAFAAAWIAADTMRFLEDAERADGVVVDLVVERVRGSDLYRPVVGFRPAGSPAEVRFTAWPALPVSAYEPGDRVEVAYRRDDPADAKLVSFWMLWLVPLVLAPLGGLCLFAGWHDYEQRVAPRAKVLAGGAGPEPLRDG